MTAQQCEHEFYESYYGTNCRKCGVFYPWGGEPWNDNDFDDWEDDDGIRDEWDDDEYEFDCGWVRGVGCQLAGTEECDWECPDRRNYEKGMALTQARLAKRAALDAREGQT